MQLVITLKYVKGFRMSVDDAHTATHLINTIGFPIFVCLILFWFIKTYLTKLINQLTDFNIKLTENTASLEKLNEKLDKINGHV